MPESPSVIVIAGPNGAGKTTAAPYLLRDALAVTEFVNADAIAAGLSGLHPERASFAAGRIMLARLRELGDADRSFGFETTLASTTFAHWIGVLKSKGYAFHLQFLSLVSDDLAVERVRQRVRLGGHDVPEEVIRRRYRRGLVNLFRMYLPLADSWVVYDNSEGGHPIQIARRAESGGVNVMNQRLFDRLKSRIIHE